MDFLNKGHLISKILPLISKIIINSCGLIATFINLLPDDLPPINADPCQLRSVFEQLLNNALKHNPPPIQLALDASIDQNMI